MSLPAIEVSGLSKRYVIQHESRHDNLRDTLHHNARKVWRKLRWGTSFEREEFWALRDVSFSIQPGEVVGIIGRNGAGKSTLLKILSRITEPTLGKVTIRGRVASLLEVGTGFHPELSGRENIFLNGAILGMSRVEIRKKFDEIVAFAEVEKFLDTPVKRYSSGMYVRLAFAVAAHLEPEILIVDEVLAVGDAQFQKKCLGKMQDVARGQGRTVLFVSHNMAAIQNLCSRTVWLRNGSVVDDGDNNAILRAYAAQPSSSADVGDIDLSRRSNIPTDNTAHFTRFGISAFTNSSSPCFSVGQPFRIHFQLYARRTLRDFTVGFSINSSEGQIIACSNHYDSLQLQELPPGSHSLTVDIVDLWLSPGRYNVTIAISQSGHSVPHDFIREVAEFTVESLLDPNCDAAPGLLDQRPGFIRHPFRWSQAQARDTVSK